MSTLVKPAAWVRPSTLAVAALILLALVWPAIWNGLPHFFPDTGGYLFVAWGNFWLVDRSSFYGAFLRPLMAWNGLSGLWLGLVPQLLATLLVLFATAKRLEARNWQWVLPIILVITTGPFHASQLMPDAYAVVVLLLGWLCASRDPHAAGSPLLWLAAAAACLPHSTFPAILVASASATILTLWIAGLSFRGVMHRAAALALTVLFIIGCQLLANGAFFHRITYAPRSSAFLYASLNEDGLLKPWLARNCPVDPRVKDLCAIAPQFHDDSQKLLWAPDSIFRTTVWQQRDNKKGVDWDTQLGIAARGALIQSPGLFAKAAVEATTEQFFSFAVLDDECPQVCITEQSAIQGALSRFRPHLRDQVNGSAQMQGKLKTVPLQVVTGTASFAGLIGLFALIPLAWRRRDQVAGSALLATVAALVANAFVTGTLSDVHDRYQSRLIWIAPLLVALILLRWRTQRLDRLKSAPGPEHAMSGAPTPPAPAP